MLTDTKCQWFMDDTLGKLRPGLTYKVKKGRQGLLCLQFALQKQTEEALKNADQIN